MEEKPLSTDPGRELLEDSVVGTGIYVRAMKAGRWQSVDIYELDKRSLMQWVNSRECFRDEVICALLGHR
jgi:hypothetical protein